MAAGRAWRSQAYATLCGVMALGMLLGAAACGGSEGALAYFAPEQKTAVSMILRPDNGRQARDQLLLALVAVPSDSETFVVGVDLGADIRPTQFNIGEGEICRLADADRVLAEEGLSRDTHLPICMSININPIARIGDHAMTLELRSDGGPIIARATFQVLEGSSGQNLTPATSTRLATGAFSEP